MYNSNSARELFCFKRKRNVTLNMHTRQVKSNQNESEIETDIIHVYRILHVRYNIFATDNCWFAFVFFCPFSSKTNIILFSTRIYFYLWIKRVGGKKIIIFFHENLYWKIKLENTIIYQELVIVFELWYANSKLNE